MRYLLFIPFVVLATPKKVAADRSECAEGPYFQPHSPPLGCPIVIQERPHLANDTWEVRARRNNSDLDVTGTIERVDVYLDYDWIEVTCQDQPTGKVSTTSERYVETRIEIPSAQVGDELYLADGTELGTVTLTAPCPELVTPEPSCRSKSWACNPPDLPDEETGCNAGGGIAALGVGVALLGFARRRRR